MKITISTLFITVFLSINGQVTSGLKLYLPFSNNTNDLSGSNNNGFLVGSPTKTQDRFKNSSCAYHFPGDTSNYIKVNYSSDFSISTTQSFSISLWYSGGSTNIGDLEFLFNKENLSNTPFQSDFHFGLYDLNKPSFGNIYSPVTMPNKFPPIPDTNWYHIVAIFNNEDWFLYQNDTLVSQRTSGPQRGITNGNGIITIGKRFNGKIDDIRFYNRAISALEVDTLYKLGSSCSSTNIIPTAKNDTILMNDGVTKIFNPRANDTDMNGDSLTITSVGLISQGMLSIINSGKNLSYTSALNFGGTLTTTYTISDGKGGTASANLIFIITDTITTSSITNKKPIAIDDNYTIQKNTNSNFSVLQNDSDPDQNDTIKLSSIIKTPKNGTSVLNIVQAKIAYTPNSNFVGKDSFDYSITDLKGLKDTARVYIDVQNNSSISSTGINTILVYPNPTQNIINIEVQNFTKELTYTITDFNGRKVKEGQIFKQKEELDIKAFSRGTYYLTILNNEQKISEQKIVKE